MTLSLVHGSKEPALWSKTVTELIKEQEAKYQDKIAVVVPWQSVRLSYRQLAERSKAVASALLANGFKHGECIGIIAGNRFEYLEVFLGGARIGCPVVVLNNNYTPEELKNAVTQSSCKMMVIAASIGQRKLTAHVETLVTGGLPELRRVVTLGVVESPPSKVVVETYTQFVASGSFAISSDAILRRAEAKVNPDDVLNLQFTSGTTGQPKAAMLTYNNLLNNARFVGAALKLQTSDIVCCPPPLFHCFGLVMGFLASFCHGSSIVFPSDHFDARLVVDALLTESPTVLLGVPTMYIAELEILTKLGKKPNTLRTGLAAGSLVSSTLMTQLRAHMGVDKMLIAYGMTETSPVTFITALDDPDDKRSQTIGRPMPHTAAKIIDKTGRVVPRGERGEICTSGYALQKGYWRNEEKTKEVMKVDEDGVLWMHTGDEAYIDEEGYGHITGRIKDIIIRGGENIWPAEIEERLMAHDAIAEASVVGLHDERYGEAVACFLKATVSISVSESIKLPHEEVKKWVTETLGRHKSPQHIFWIGDSAVGDDFPKTGSGKHQKHILRDIGNKLVKRTAKL